jgi:hypothetical protein
MVRNTKLLSLLGARVPELGTPQWRWLYTQQHGDNLTYEVQVEKP